MISWDKSNRSVTDEEAAEVLAANHPKSKPPVTQTEQADLLNQGSAGQPAVGLAVGGDLPIGAFQS